MMEFINGKKSYLFVAGAAIAFALNMIGILDEESFKWVLGICTAGYAASMRHAVKKTEEAAAGTNV